MISSYDIAIVGAGFVGASLAVALKENGFKIALIDAQLPSLHDKRLFALNITSVNFLSRIGIWSRVHEHASIIKRVQISRQKRLGVVQLNCEDMQLSALGYMIPAREIETALNQALSLVPTIDCYRPMQLQSLIEEEDGVQLHVAQNKETTRTIHAKYVIGADGTQSTVRSALNWQTTDTKNNNQEMAIVAQIALNKTHDHIAYERFYHEGVIAMLPLKNDVAALIWTTQKAEAECLLAMPDDLFLKHLQTLFGYRLGPLQALASVRVSYPLHTVFAKKTASKRVLLIGNAAHTLHPIAAQGFNLALYEIANLADAIIDAPNDFSDFTLLTIQEECRKQQKISVNTSQFLANVIHKPSFFKDLALQMGMLGLECLPFVKRRFLQALIYS